MPERRSRGEVLKAQTMSPCLPLDDLISFEPLSRCLSPTGDTRIPNGLAFILDFPIFFF